jgi:1-deoxy-D-xylulose-5-phosphate reductoisomerase
MSDPRSSLPPLYRCPDEPPARCGPVRVVLLGATGSIGRQTIDLVRRFPGRLQLVAATAATQAEELAELLAGVAESAPDVAAPRIALADEAARARAAAWPGWRARLLSPGAAGLCEAAAWPEADVVMNALVGAVGLAPTLAAVGCGVCVALANKESLVVGGDLVRAAAAASGARLLPVDSEHSAIAQCLAGRAAAEIESLTLTASGGPFHDWPAERLRDAVLADVLRHPTWNMGPKVTVDSATLMNKGLEVIEAHHLFGVPYADIGVMVHPGSLVHSLVTFRDGAVMAQLGAPDMRVPLLFALAGERHWPLDTERLDLVRIGTLRFAAPDLVRFPCLALARGAAEAGGRAPIVLNAANEIAVAGLLAGRLRFADIAAVIERTLAAIPGGPVESLEEALAVDQQARRIAAGAA